MTIHNTIAALAVAAACTCSLAQAELITNGNFDTFVPTNGTGGGWTSSLLDGGGSAGQTTSGGNPGANFILNAFGSSSDDPTISQLVSGLTPTQSYILSGDYAGIYTTFGNPSALSFSIDVDGITVASLSRPGAENVYGSFSIPLVATDSDFLIAFRAESNGDDSSYRIDNIALTVPEPGSAVLVYSGCAMLYFLRRRGYINHKA